VSTDEAELHPQLRQLLADEANAPPVAVEHLTAEAVRIADLAVLELQRAPTSLYAIEDCVVPSRPDLDARLYQPKRGSLPTIVYFHGGGFVIGAAGYDRPLRDLAATTGCLVVAPNVRLAPEHPFPAPLEDALACAGWVVETAHALGGSLPIVIAGDSSGGNLAAVTTRQLSRERGLIDAQVLIYPMLDATASSPSYAEFGTGYGFTREKALWYFDQYLPQKADRHDPRVSPLFAPDLEGLPPTLVITAACDPLRDEGERYVDAIRAAGGEATLRRFDGMIHGFFQMGGVVDGAHQAQVEIAHWLQATTTWDA
jgi:acetyl esterase